MTFQERAKLAVEQLLTQGPVTLKKAREQAKRLRAQSNVVVKKQRD